MKKRAKNKILAKSMKPRAGFEKRQTKLINLQPAHQEKKKREREKTQLNKIINEGGEITSDTKEIQKIIREHNEKLFANKLNNRRNGEIPKRYNLTKVNQEEIENLNTSISINKIKSAKNSQKANVQDQTASQMTSANT